MSSSSIYKCSSRLALSATNKVGLQSRSAAVAVSVVAFPNATSCTFHSSSQDNDRIEKLLKLPNWKDLSELKSSLPENNRGISSVLELELRMAAEDKQKSYHQYAGTSNCCSAVDEDPLPRTLEEALEPSDRAIVITEATKPFRVFSVNKAWENLCGYTLRESQGQTLGSLLNGPETDRVAATALITQLLRGEKEAGTTLTNYTKTNRRFRNRIRVGPLLEDGSSNSSVTHFVGVLDEVRGWSVSN